MKPHDSAQAQTRMKIHHASSIRP